MRTWRFGLVALLLVAVSAGAGCAGGSGRQQSPVAPPPASSPGAPLVPGTTPPPGGGGGGQTAAPVLPRRLADFFTGARAVDVQLRRAATLINRGVHTDVVVINPDMVQAVRRADPYPLRADIPGGLDPRVLRAVLLVYSDLVSRRIAMRRIEEYASFSPLARHGTEAEDLIFCLGEGSAGAHRFATDLAAARALARKLGAGRAVAADSRASAEVAVRIAYIDGFNGGCDNCGGGIFPKLLPLVWQGSTSPGYSGTIAGVGFRATFVNGSRWWVALDAC